MNNEVYEDDVNSVAGYDERAAHQEPDFLVLEERIMFDGAMGAEAVDAAVDHAADAPSDPEPTADLEAAAAAVSIPASDQSEIYFIDSGVDNPDDLIAAIPDGAEVVVLDGSSDGLVQIASVLDGRSDLDAIHILSHGAPGEITLGNTTLDAASIDGHHADELATIKSALSDSADILIYGCDFGQDEATLAALAEATGADVAASDDDTGHADLGGDWDLEVASGEIETEGLEATEWSGTLDLVAEHDRFSGLVDYAATGGSLRAEPNTGNSAALNPTSTGELLLPAGITGSDVVGAYLYWAGSGNTIDTQVSLNGQLVTAQETHTAEYNPTERYFAGRADVTSIIQANGAGVYTFGGLTVDNGPPFSTFSTVMAGWSMTVVYRDSSLTANQSVVLLDGLELLLNDGIRTPSTTVDIQGLEITSDSGRLTTTVYEGDAATSTAETIRVNNADVGGTGIWNSVSNTPGVGNGAPAYGLDIETFDLSGLVSVGDTSVEVEISTGSNDQVLITNTVLTFESNLPPVGVDDTISVTEDTPTTQNVLANDTDNEGDPLTVSTVTAAMIDTNGDGTSDPLTLGAPTALTDSGGNPIGTITVAMNGNVTFDPAPDYNGPIPDLTYTPSDGTVDGNPATVSFGSITPVADIVDDSASTAEDTPVNTDVLANDGFTDPG
ncbi:MAG: hypothetical protein CMI67_20840, partial [Pelagibaca sp.]|nr:hypothetical protein [Pelagibaca sp.]